MSDEREFHEMDEAKLEQVSGGRRNIATYVCPVCGYKELEPYVYEIELNHPHYCVPCQLSKNGRVDMIRQ